MEKVIKIVLAFLFFICLADMPYGFYQLVRFLALIGFGILAFQSHSEKRSKEAVIYVVLAVLFQPFLKISLGREIWNLVDVMVGIGLLVTIWVGPRSRND